MEQQIAESLNSMKSRLVEWFDIIIINLPNFLLAIIVFSLTYWVARKVQKWITKPLQRFVNQDSVRELIANFAAIVITAIGLFLALGIMNLDTVLKSLLAGAGVAGLAIGLALQGTLSNTFSGIFLAVKDVMNIGDFVESNGFNGTVHEINLRNTKIKETDNNIVVLPNKMVIESPFKNYGLTNRLRITVKCGVGYESDLQQVKDLTIKTIENRWSQHEGENVEFHYLEFGDSSINFQTRFYVDAVERLSILEARSEAIMLIKQAFDEQGINIPFPIRTLKIDNMSKDNYLRVKTPVNGEVKNGQPQAVGS